MTSEHIKIYEAKAKKMGTEIEQMEAKLKTLEADARVHYEENLAALKEQQRNLLRKCEKAKEASGEALDVLQEGVTAAWTELSNGISSAKKTFEARV